MTSIIYPNEKIVRLNRAPQDQQVAQGRRYTIIQATPHSPVAIIQALYQKAAKQLVRQAYLNYLLQYQHYNAEFTIVESDQLGYQPPIFTPQTRSGYVRTEYIRLLELTDPWITKKVIPFLSNGFNAPHKAKDYVKLGTSDIDEFIRFSFSKDFDVISFKEWVLSRPIETGKNQVIIVQLALSDLVRGIKGHDLLNAQLRKLKSKQTIKEIQTQCPNVQFLFFLSTHEKQTVIMWGAEWAKQKKTNLLALVQLSDSQFFGNTFFSQLNRAGIVPDRTRLNWVMTSELGDKSSSWQKDLQSIGFKQKGKAQHVTIHPKSSTNQWRHGLKACLNWDLGNDRGCIIYRDAIIKWNEIFKSVPRLLTNISPLLYDQVLPWMFEEGSLVQWSKAYQNLCEIVMFALQAYPKEFEVPPLEQSVFDSLGPIASQSQIEKSVGLFPYGMSAATFALKQIIEREANDEHPPRLACISQHYFETLNLLSDLKSQGKIIYDEYDSIEQIEQSPDILIADIHPNNAARKILFPNSVAIWVKEQLESDPKKNLSLILDITLNHFSDPVVQEALEMLKPFIEGGRLEIYMIQSVAKLVQLGADNFSGGLSVYLGDQTPPKFPKDLVEREKYFSLLLHEFSDLSKVYFDRVRYNNSYVYQKLSIKFEHMLDRVKPFKGGQGFCGVEVTHNSDENTCYVSLSLTPLLKRLHVRSQGPRENFCKEFKKLILDVADFRNLPMTGRQSFGFPLSNLSDVCDSIRYSVGIENENQLNENCTLIADCVELISRYALKHKHAKEYKKLFIDLRKSFGLVNVEKDLIPFKYTVNKESYGEPSPKVFGEATIQMVNGELNVTIQSHKDKVKHVFTQEKLEVCGSHHMILSKWNQNLTQNILFRLLALDHKTLTFSYDKENDRCLIFGLIPDPFLFSMNHSSNESEKFRVSYSPEFKISVDRKDYPAEKIFAVLEGFGSEPVRISRLHGKELYSFYQRCEMHHWQAELNAQGCLQITFNERKHLANYPEWIKTLLKEGGLKKVVETLNEIETDQLPLSYDHCWNNHVPGKKALIECLLSIGYSLPTELTEALIPIFYQIKSTEFKNALRQGLIAGLTSFESNISSEQASLCRLILENHSIHAEEIRYPIFKLHKNKNKEDAEWTKNIVSALMPILKSTFSHSKNLLYADLSCEIKELAISIEHDELLSHFETLETKLINSASNIQRPQYITDLLSHFLSYPWSDEKNISFLENLRETDPEIIKHWLINSPDILHIDLPWEFYCWQEWRNDDTLIGHKDREELTQFFKETDFRNFLFTLLEESEENIESIMKWAITLDDQELTDAINKITGSELPLVDQLRERVMN